MTDTRVAWLLGIAGGGLALYVLAPILTPFVLSALLAYVANPVVGRLERRGVPRTLGVVLVFAVLFLAILGLLLVVIPLVNRQLAAFVGKLPGYLDWLQRVFVPWVQAALGTDLPGWDVEALKAEAQQHWRELGQAAGKLFSYVTRSGLHVAAWLMNLLLIPVVTFYLLRDWDGIVERVQALAPARLRKPLAALARETDEVLGSFLRGQLAVMLALAVVYSTGLWLVGLDLALPIGAFAGLVSFVPYLGFIAGVLFAGVAAILQFQEPSMLVWVVAVFGIGQLLEGMLLTPYLVGERIGLHPVAVIFAVLAGGQLFGFFGVLLALPAAAVLLVWVRHAHTRLIRGASAGRGRGRR